MLKKSILLFAALTLTGCAVDSRPAFRDVDATVYDRTGHHVQWNEGSGSDRRVSVAVHELLSHELSVDGAVQIALLNNPSLQANFENVGIAQADLVQAGLLRNPEFAASWRLPDRAPHQTDVEYAVSEDFLELLVLPVRKKVAAAELERTKATVADVVLKLVADVKAAFYTVQAEEQLIGRLEVVADATRNAADLADRQHAAGTVNDLDLATQESIAAQSELEITQATLDLAVAREKLNRLLGLGEDKNALGWKAEPHLADLPAADPSLDSLEETALRQRLDLAASRQGVAALAKSVGLTEEFRYFSALKLGVDTEHNPGGPNVTGPTLDLELPLFDQGQARLAKIRGQYRQARDQLLQQTLDIRAEVRETYARLAANRTLAERYTRTLLPQRRGIVELTQRHYNAMLKGTYDLLIARENEVATERGSIETAKNYWIARADLERAVGGRLPSPPTTQSTHMNGDKP